MTGNSFQEGLSIRGDLLTPDAELKDGILHIREWRH